MKMREFAVVPTGQLLKHRVSDNVGGVKQFLSTLQHALVEERHFALVEAFAFALPTQARS
jgi:hypothetical protein